MAPACEGWLQSLQCKPITFAYGLLLLPPLRRTLPEVVGVVGRGSRYTQSRYTQSVLGLSRPPWEMSGPT